MTKTYIYIFEDGIPYESPSAPTSDEIAAIADGLLQVFEVQGSILEFDVDGILKPVTPLV
jgi:hypothetical protein